MLKNLFNLILNNDQNSFGRGEARCDTHLQFLV